MSETAAGYRVKNKNGKMSNNTRNAFASYGLEILKQSVLLVLYDAHRDGEPYLGYNDIHEALGIARIREVNRKAVKDYFVHGILLHLWEDGSVEVVGDRAEFQITEKGISVIEG